MEEAKDAALDLSAYLYEDIIRIAQRLIGQLCPILTTLNNILQAIASLEASGRNHLGRRRKPSEILGFFQEVGHMRDRNHHHEDSGAL